MQEELYSVVLRFDPGDQGACDQVRIFLGEFNRLDPGRIEKTIARGRLLLKRNADHATAVKLQQRVRVNGATCVLEKQTDRQASSGQTLKFQPLDQQKPPETDEEIICPKCETRQPSQTECRRCGVVFAKIRATPKPVDIQAQKPPELSAATPAPAKKQNFARTFIQRHLPAIKALQDKLTLWHRNLRQWSQKPINALFNCAVLFLTAMLLNTCLLFLCKYLWFLYTATTAGEHYTIAYKETATVISMLLARDPVALAWEVALLVLVVNLIIALISRFTHIARMYLDGGGLIAKLIWIVSSALGSAWLLSQREPMPPLAMALILTLMPTICLLGGCLNLARTLLPEMGAVFSELARAVRHRDNLLAALKNIHRNWNDIKKKKKTEPAPPMQGDMDA